MSAPRLYPTTHKAAEAWLGRHNRLVLNRQPAGPITVAVIGGGWWLVSEPGKLLARRSTKLQGFHALAAYLLSRGQLRRAEGGYVLAAAPAPEPDGGAPEAPSAADRLRELERDASALLAKVGAVCVTADSARTTAALGAVKLACEELRQARIVAEVRAKYHEQAASAPVAQAVGGYQDPGEIGPAAVDDFREDTTMTTTDDARFDDTTDCAHCQHRLHQHQRERRGGLSVGPYRCTVTGCPCTLSPEDTTMSTTTTETAARILAATYQQVNPTCPDCGHAFTDATRREIDAHILTAQRRHAWSQLARQWAAARWCWDDVEDDLTGERGTQAYLAGERPDAFVNDCANHWDLEDPTTHWGSLSSDADIARRQQLRDVIGAFMQEQGASR